MAKKKKQPKDNYSIWDNPMITSLKKQLSEEDVEKYKTIGESMYGNLDYSTNKIQSDIPPEEEALAYIEESIKSGLHPSMLEQNEKDLLEYKYGREWFEKWGYIKEDLDDIVTIKKE